MTYYPCRIIRSEFGTSMGVFMYPCETVGAALEKALKLSGGPADFRENLTVVMPLAGSYVTVPETTVSELKEAMLR